MLALKQCTAREQRHYSGAETGSSLAATHISLWHDDIAAIMGYAKHHECSKALASGGAARGRRSDDIAGIMSYSKHYGCPVVLTMAVVRRHDDIAAIMGYAKRHERSKALTSGGRPEAGGVTPVGGVPEIST